MYSIYNYKQSFDISYKFKNDFISYLFWQFGMKPKYQYSKKTQRLYMTLFGYSLEEKAKNKNMILQAMHDYIREQAEKPF